MLLKYRPYPQNLNDEKDNNICTDTSTNPVAFVFVSKYMVRKYGLNEAIKRAQANKRVKVYRVNRKRP